MALNGRVHFRKQFFHTSKFWSTRTYVCSKFSKFSRVQRSGSGRQGSGGGRRGQVREGRGGGGKEDSSQCRIVGGMAGSHTLIMT